MFPLLLLGLCVGSVSGQGSRTTTVVFDSYRHDYGTIKETDGMVRHTFHYKNEGDFPFVILSVGVSCGCTMPQFSKEPLLPGNSAEFTVTFDPTNRPGAFEKTINILSNDARRNIQLVVTGNVIPRPRTIRDDYPFHVHDGLRIQDKSVTIGQLPRGKTSNHTVGIANEGKTQIRVAVDRSKLPPYVTVRPKKEVLGPEERSELLVTINATGQDAGKDLWGRHTYSFPLVVNGQKQPEDIDLMVTFVEDFSALTAVQKSKPPRAEFNSFFYHFSEQKQGKPLTRQFQITNRGTGDLLIRHLGPSGPQVRASVDKTVIKPGDTATLTVTLDTKDALGRISGNVTVITNDPEKPARDIRVMAEVVK